MKTLSTTRILLWAMMAVATIAATGCRSHKHLNKGDDNDGTVITDNGKAKEEPPRLDTIMNISYRQYTANFSCTVEGIAVNGQIRMAKDSVIWVSINKVIELGRVILTPSRVQGYVKILNKYFDGNYDDLRRQFGIDIDFATLESLLAGNCPPRCANSKEPQRNGNSVTLWYNQKTNGTHQRQVTLSKDYISRRLRTTQIASASIGQQIELQYLRNENVAGQLVPTEIALKLKSRKLNTSTTIQLDKVALNKQQTYPFSIPKRYKQYGNE